MLKNTLTVLALVLVAAAGLVPFSGAPRAAAVEDALALEAPAPETAPLAEDDRG